MVSLLRCIVFETFLEYVTHGLKHLTLDISHPEFDITVLGVDSFDKVYLLTFDRHHGDHAVIVAELQISNGFKHLSEMASDTTHLFSLRQDLKQVIIGEEIESRKVRPLLLEVLFETFLNHLKTLVSVNEVVFKTFLAAVVKNAWVLMSLIHDETPLDIDALEALGLHGQLLHDIS